MTGGQSVFIRNLVPRLDADVTMVGTTSGREPLGCRQRRTLRGVGYDFVPVARMPAPGRPPLVPLRLTSCLGVARFRRRILAAGDVMYVHSPEMGLPLGLGRRRRPIVLHAHGAANPLSASRYPWARAGALRRLYGALQRRVVRTTALVLSVDEDGLDLARAALPAGSRTRLVLSPICVDMDVFSPGDGAQAKAALGLPCDARLLLFVGRLERAKGTERLVEAFSALARERDDLVLGLLGDGSQRPAMEAQARRAGVLDKLRLAGWVEHDALPVWFRAADALLLPSDYEGLPTAVVEALACGVPVVASAVGGLPGLIHDGENGLLLRECTAETLAAATADVLDRAWPIERLTASVEAYSAERVAASVGALLAEAARRHG